VQCLVVSGVQVKLAESKIFIHQFYENMPFAFLAEKIIRHVRTISFPNCFSMFLYTRIASHGS